MSSFPPPPNLPDVIPGEDAGDYAARKATERTVVDALQAARAFALPMSQQERSHTAEDAVDLLVKLDLALHLIATPAT